VFAHGLFIKYIHVYRTKKVPSENSNFKDKLPGRQACYVHQPIILKDLLLERQRTDMDQFVLKSTLLMHDNVVH
jgi:hypothetical protein